MRAVAKNMRASSATVRFSLWGLWSLACVLATVAAAGWSTDNGLATWVGASGVGEAVMLLREGFGGDEVVIVRLVGSDELERGWLEAFGPRLAELPSVAQVVDPLRLADGVSGALEPRPVARALDLFGPERLDYLLLLEPASAPPARAALVERLQVLARETAQLGASLHAAGHPLVAAELDRQSARVERVFVPLLILLATATVAWLLKSLWLGLATILPAILASSAARAVLCAIGLPSNMILVALGPLALVLVLAATLQLTFAFRRHAECMPPPQAARAALREKRAAALLAAATTAAGFGVFVTSPLLPVARLGVAVALTVMIGVPLAYVGLPPLLAGMRLHPSPAGGAFGRTLRRLAARCARRRGIVVALSAGVFAIGAVGLWELPHESNALTFFEPAHPLRRAFEAIESEGGGLSTVEVLCRDVGGGALGETLARISGVRGVFGPEHVRAELDRLGASGGLVEALEHKLLRQAQRIDETGRWQRWTVRFATSGAAETRALVERIEHGAQGWAGEQGLHELHVTGTLPAMLEAQDQLIATLRTSLGLTFCVTLLAFLLVCRDGLELVAALVANLFPVACALAAAWMLDYALDAATVMVAAVVLGLAVDNTFHLMHAARGTGNTRRLRLLAFSQVGGAAVASSAALAVGFASLYFSGFAPTARFGLLTAVGAAGALLGDLVLLPALWLRTPART